MLEPTAKVGNFAVMNNTPDRSGTSHPPVRRSCEVEERRYEYMERAIRDCGFDKEKTEILITEYRKVAEDAMWHLVSEQGPDYKPVLKPRITPFDC